MYISSTSIDFHQVPTMLETSENVQKILELELIMGQITTINLDAISAKICLARKHVRLQ